MSTGNGASIAGVGKAIPQRVVPNSEIAQRLMVEPEWIQTRTGILERRFASAEDSAASLAVDASRQALTRAGIGPDAVGCVIVATCTPDYVFPPTATLVAESLGIKAPAAFDVSAACSGFVYSLAVGASLLRTGTVKGAVLIAGADLLSRHLNLDDPKTAPLFGDGAGAVVLVSSADAAPIEFELASDGSGAEHVIVPSSGSKLDPTAAAGRVMGGCISMAGREVFRKAVKTMTEQAKSLGGDGFDLLVAHQANRRILDECAKQLGVENEKVFVNIERYGNTSAASVPIALCEAWEQDRLTPGDRLIMLAFGAGYTWGGAKMIWTLPAPDEGSSKVTEPELTKAAK